MDLWSIACHVLFTLTFSYITSVECLSCLQCSSLFDTGCLEGSLMPIQCENASFIYCLKYETIDAEVKFVNRDCSIKEVSGCNNMVFPEKTVRVCRSTCMGDGCNAASSIYARRSLNDITLLSISVISAVYVIPIKWPLHWF